MEFFELERRAYIQRHIVGAKNLLLSIYSINVFAVNPTSGAM